MNKSLLRDIPKVDDLLRSPTLAHLFADAPRVSVTEALREELDNIRKNILDGALDALPCTEDILSSAAERARLKSRPSLRGVINGTGVVLHTNLGRACLAREAVDAVINAATGYSTLEYDVANGCRGSLRQARPRFVCSTTPVALITPRSDGSAASSARARMPAQSAGASGRAVLSPRSTASRSAESSARTASRSVLAGRSNAESSGLRSNSSTFGIARSKFVSPMLPPPLFRSRETPRTE